MKRLSESEIRVAVERHLSRNNKLNRLMVSKGVDLDVPRPIDLHFWANDEKAARNFAVALETKGYSQVSTNLSARDPALWNVEALIQASPLAVTAPLCVEKLIRLAARITTLNSMGGGHLFEARPQQA